MKTKILLEKGSLGQTHSKILNVQRGVARPSRGCFRTSSIERYLETNLGLLGQHHVCSFDIHP